LGHMLLRFHIPQKLLDCTYSLSENRENRGKIEGKK
jgi:hypothetical protein